MKYLFLKSLENGESAVEKQATKLFNHLEGKTGHKFTNGSVSEVEKELISIVYVATGGTAGMFKEAVKSLKEPIVIITSASNNSLSASMEMMTYLANQGKKGRLLHGSDEEIATSVDQILSAVRARDSLKRFKFGLIGNPSDWLISTDVDYEALKQTLGIEIVQIEMSELLDEISKKDFPDDEGARELQAKDFDKDEINKALEIYGAFSRIVDKYKLNGISVRCFDLLTAVNNTGCLGLSILNKRGIYGGCEGDLPSLISMAILGEISGQPVFMSNPSSMDKNSGEIVFAHCTLPLNMAGDYKLDTHFESDIGVAIAGNMALGSATIFKASGSLDRHFISSASILESLNQSDLCRTQIRLHCDKELKEFTDTPVGNHYLVCLGDYSHHIEEFMGLL